MKQKKRVRIAEPHLEKNPQKKSLAYHERNKFIQTLLKQPEDRTEKEVDILTQKLRNLDFFKKFLEDNNYEDLKELIRHCYYE